MFVNRIEIQFGFEMNPHLIIRNRARFKSPVCRFVRLKFMNRVISRPDDFGANLARFESDFIRSFSASSLWWIRNQTSYVERINPDRRDSKILLTLPVTNRLESPAMRDSCPVTAITTMFGSTVTPMVAGSFSEQRLMKSWTDLSHTVNVNIQAKDRFFSRHQNTVSGARASYAFDQSWHNPDGTSEGILRAEAHTHFTHYSFFQTDLSSKQLWFIDLIQTSDCRSQNLAKFALCRKILRR